MVLCEIANHGLIYSFTISLRWACLIELSLERSTINLMYVFLCTFSCVEKYSYEFVNINYIVLKWFKLFEKYVIISRYINRVPTVLKSP